MKAIKKKVKSSGMFTFPLIGERVMLIQIDCRKRGLRWKR